MPLHRKHPDHPVEYVKTIERLERVGTSAMGNPTWLVRFTDGHTARTETDGSVGYSIENHTVGKNKGRPVRVKAHARSGRIWDVTFVDGSRP